MPKRILVLLVGSADTKETDAYRPLALKAFTKPTPYAPTAER